MFKRRFWKFLPRYGMKKYYSDVSVLKEMALRLYLTVAHQSESFYIDTQNRVHIDPRGGCGAKGKVLCYELMHGRWTYKGKHYRPKHVRDGTLCK